MEQTKMLDYIIPIAYIEYVTYGLFFFFTLILVCEMVYSFKKKDGVYTPAQSFSNVTNWLYFVYISGREIGGAALPLLLVALGYVFSTPPEGYSLLTILCVLVLVDFVAYVMHYVNHRTTFFWLMHSVHHSDRLFNMTTFFRGSFLQQIVGIIYYVPIMLIFDLQIVAALSLFVTVYQYICHSPYIHFWTPLEKILISPRLHKIHHDQRHEYQSNNLGSLFVIWDMIFDTLRTDDPKDYQAGIANYPQQNNIIRMQVDPIIKWLNRTIKKNEQVS